MPSKKNNHMTPISLMKSSILSICCLFLYLQISGQEHHTPFENTIHVPNGNQRANIIMGLQMQKQRYEQLESRQHLEKLPNRAAWINHHSWLQQEYNPSGYPPFNRRNTIEFTRPTIGHDEGWNDDTNDWNYFKSIAFAYDSLARIIRKTHFDTLFFDTSYIEIFRYNPSGKLESKALYIKGQSRNFEKSELDSFVYFDKYDESPIAKYYYFMDPSTQTLDLVFGERKIMITENDNVTEVHHEEYSGFEWYRSASHYYQYTSEKLLDNHLYCLTYPDNSLDTLYRVTFHYTSDNKTLDYIIQHDYFDGVFTPSSRISEIVPKLATSVFNHMYILQLDLDLKDLYQSLIYKEWDDMLNDWEPVFKLVTTTQPLPNKSLQETTIISFWNSTTNRFIDANKTTRFSSKNIIVTTEEMNENNQWKPEYRDSFFFNDFDENYGFSVEFFDAQLNSWVTLFKEKKTDILHQDGHLLHTITRYWDFITNTMENANRMSFSEWETFQKEEEILGLSSNPMKPQIHVYPNPFDNTFQLLITEEGSSVTVLDYSGKTILKPFTVSSGIHSIHLNHFPSGLYMINISSPSGIFYQKVMKQ
jgi:hypothetical protein